ncbi:hypothetical protein EGM88_15750 [Aureibaculum marinum]|uniref:Uncharacterized protein n=1 Tax=Aureibaculum marinum TaxID=2487930 RepID=A0A3N4N1X2_9FLAO|nr:hypothetical protein [Aureibaculum marinum]RPD90071.1 hypothetical protein EGM88_15750 [Aureibaculum marinum]
MFEKIENIKNYDKILSIAINNDYCEHIEDIIALLEKYDKKRERQSVELKMCVFTVIRDVLKDPKIKPWYECSFVEEIKINPPKNEKGIFDYLNKYWYKFDEIGRAYLLFFKRMD